MNDSYTMRQRNQHGLPGPMMIPYFVCLLHGQAANLIVTWIGINDCQRFMDAQSQLTSFFKLQDKLYKHGARNFVFLNVPPFDRSPACPPPPFLSFELY